MSPTSELPITDFNMHVRESLKLVESHNASTSALQSVWRISASSLYGNLSTVEKSLDTIITQMGMIDIKRAATTCAALEELSINKDLRGKLQHYREFMSNIGSIETVATDDVTYALLYDQTIKLSAAESKPPEITPPEISNLINRLCPTECKTQSITPFEWMRLSIRRSWAKAANELEKGLPTIRASQFIKTLETHKDTMKQEMRLALREETSDFFINQAVSACAYKVVLRPCATTDFGYSRALMKFMENEVVSAPTPQLRDRATRVLYQMYVKARKDDPIGLHRHTTHPRKYFGDKDESPVLWSSDVDKIVKPFMTRNLPLGEQIKVYLRNSVDLALKR